MGLKGIRTRTSRYVAGYGVVIELSQELPRDFDAATYGDATAKGLVLTGTVADLFGVDAITGWKPVWRQRITVTVRPNDQRRMVFEDLVKTGEVRRFLLEGVTGDEAALAARWAHGAGRNRSIQKLEIVGPPHISFENPVKEDGPKSGYLRLNLDGSPTTFDERMSDGTYEERSIPYQTVVERLAITLERNRPFLVGQRALFPSLAKRVGDQKEFEECLALCRTEGMTHCVVRTFVPGTRSTSQVDVQVLAWPRDIPANDTHPGVTYEMPALLETKRFAALRDGAPEAQMEIIPGCVLNLVGNPNDKAKSVKHKFAQDVVNGMSDRQKAMFASQFYGPGIAIRAMNEKGELLGLVRPATRTEGPQYRNLLMIRTAHFDGTAVELSTGTDKPAESASGASAAS